MIKRIFQFLFMITVCISAYSQATGLADLKFGQYQIADSQWNVQACTQTATCQIYSKNPGIAYQIPWYSGQLTWATGDYVAFVATGDTTNPWNAIQYAGNGTQKAVMGTGHIINMGNDYFFFVGNDNDTGQLFSMTQGFANTSGVTWTGTLNPTVTQVNAYATNGSTTPLAAGQTSGPPPPVTTTTNSQGSSLTMTTGPGTSVITQGQQAKITLHQNYTASNKLIHIDQIGDNNIVTIDQTGHGEINLTMQGNTNTTNINQGGIGIGQNQIKMNTLGDTNIVNVNQGRNANGTPAGSNGHYVETDIVGTNNSLTLQQNNTGGVGGHFMITSVNGNQNSVIAKQNDNGNKIMFIDVSGNSNIADIVQKGTGQHYLDLKMNGAQNNAVIVQEGTQPNKATIDMTRGLGGPNNLDLIQSSTTNPLSINLLQTCTNLAGCGTVIIRQN